MRLSRNILASSPLAVRRVVTDQNGTALVLALVTMLLVSMIGLFGSVTGQTELKITKNEEDSKKALNVAEAGVRHALHLLANGSAYQNGFNDELSNGGTGGGLAAAGSTVTSYPGDTGPAALLQYRFFSFGGSATGDGYYVRAIDNHDSDGSSNTDIDQRFILISRGKFGTAEKTIEALIAPPTPCAITTGDRLNVGGSVSSSDLQVNTTDGFGACVHANGPLDLSGNATFPDGATSSLGDPPGDCSGNPNIAGGNCNQALWNQPPRELPNTNPGQYGKWVADLGNANPGGPFYILHATSGTVRKGGGCYYSGPSIGNCGSSITYPDSTTSPADQGAAVPQGVSFDTSTGRCIFSGNNGNPILPGIYYCEGKVENSGQANGPGVTIISRDDMSFTSQTNLSAFFPNAGMGTGQPAKVATDALNALPSGSIKDKGIEALERLQNLVMMVGNDLDFSGNNTVITGIILIHNQINMTGGKTINGYISAADGLPAFAGDPHPAGSTSTINPALTYNQFLGSSQINYMNWGTANPMGAPILRAWNDGQW
jgi:hypothetical protein